jgi:hypothetical protein
MEKTMTIQKINKLKPNAQNLSPEMKKQVLNAQRAKQTARIRLLSKKAIEASRN